LTTEPSVSTSWKSVAATPASTKVASSKRKSTRVSVSVVRFDRTFSTDSRSGASVVPAVSVVFCPAAERRHRRSG
jgi:hypothetical protein